MKSGQMASYRDDIKNTHVFRNRKKYGEWSGQREEIRETGQIGALPSRVFISSSSKRHPRGPESVDGRAPKSGSGHYVPASVHVCSHPTLS
jgi:hypothetical protein